MLKGMIHMNCQPGVIYFVKLNFNDEGEVKISSDEN